MKKETILFCLCLFCLPATKSAGQSPFTNCSAAFLNQKLVVNEYTDQGKCVLKSTATGELTVCTAVLSPTDSKPVDRLPFKIAIRDRATGTLVMYSGDTYHRIEVQKVLAQCRPGDRIVLLTLDREYALPHNEILVE